MNFYLIIFPISNLSVMDMTVSFQIMFSDVPEQIILKGITGSLALVMVVLNPPMPGK